MDAADFSGVPDAELVSSSHPDVNSVSSMDRSVSIVPEFQHSSSGGKGAGRQEGKQVGR